jgi:hypothetical protein
MASLPASSRPAPPPVASIDLLVDAGFWSAGDCCTKTSGPTQADTLIVQAMRFKSMTTQAGSVRELPIETHRARALD